MAATSLRPVAAWNSVSRAATLLGQAAWAPPPDSSRARMSRDLRMGRLLDTGSCRLNPCAAGYRLVSDLLGGYLRSQALRAAALLSRSSLEENRRVTVLCCLSSALSSATAGFCFLSSAA